MTKSAEGTSESPGANTAAKRGSEPRLRGRGPRAASRREQGRVHPARLRLPVRAPRRHEHHLQRVRQERQGEPALAERVLLRRLQLHRQRRRERSGEHQDARTCGCPRIRATAHREAQEETGGVDRPKHRAQTGERRRGWRELRGCAVRERNRTLPGEPLPRSPPKSRRQRARRRGWIQITLWSNPSPTYGFFEQRRASVFDLSTKAIALTRSRAQGSQLQGRPAGTPYRIVQQDRYRSVWTAIPRARGPVPTSASRQNYPTGTIRSASESSRPTDTTGRSTRRRSRRPRNESRATKPSLIQLANVFAARPKRDDAAGGCTGIDLGSNDYVITCDGVALKAHQAGRKDEPAARRRQRAVARCTKGSFTVDGNGACATGSRSPA